MCHKNVRNRRYITVHTLSRTEKLIRKCREVWIPFNKLDQWFFAVHQLWTFNTHRLFSVGLKLLTPYKRNLTRMRWIKGLHKHLQNSWVSAASTESTYTLYQHEAWLRQARRWSFAFQTKCQLLSFFPLHMQPPLFITLMVTKRHLLLFFFYYRKGNTYGA